MNMSIHVGGYWDGVCIRSYHMPINTLEKLERIVHDYQYALKRALQIRSMLVDLQ